MVICLERGADCLHMVQLMPLHPKTPSSLPYLGFTFLVPAYPGYPGKEAVNLNGCGSSNSSSLLIGEMFSSQ